MLTLEQQLLNEIFYDIKIKGHLHLWQWRLVFQIAEMPFDDQEELIEFYCLDSEESPVQDAKAKLDTLGKHKRNLIETCIGDMLQIEPSKLIDSFAFYNDAINRLDYFQINTSELRIKKILANNDIEYILPKSPTPPPRPPKPLSMETKYRAPYQKQLVLLETALGIVPLYRVLTPEGWNRILPFIELDEKQTRIFKAYYGIKGLAKTPTEIITENTDITKEDIDKTLRRVRMRLMQTSIQNIIALCLSDSQRAVEIIENLDKELYRRSHSRQFNFIKNIMDIENLDEIKILTANQWELFMKVFDLKKEYCATLIGLFGIYDGKEKDKHDAAKEFGVEPNDMYLGIQSLKVMFHRIGKQNNFTKERAKRLIMAFWNDDEQLIKYYEKLGENSSKYKRQIAFLQKVTGNLKITDPLPITYWKEIMDSLNWNKETRSFFNRYFGINGDGELSTRQIAEQDGNDNMADYKRIMGTAYRNLFDRHVDDLKEALNYYYDGGPFDSFNIGRTKQKDLLKSLSGREKVRVLLKNQWDIIFDALDVKPSHRLAFYYYYGVQGYGAGMTPAEMADYFTNQAKEQGKTQIEFEEKTIEFDRAESVFANLVHIPYLNLRKGNVPNIIADMLERGTADVSTLVNKNQLDFLRSITEKEDVVILTTDQWNDVMKHAAILPIRRKIFSLRFGLADGEEKSISRVSDILDREMSWVSYSYYTIGEKLMREENLLLINHYMDLNRGSKSATQKVSSVLEDDSIFQHQNQFEFLSKILGGNHITEPLPPEIWQEIMIGLRWTEEMCSYFTRFFDINGEGEMSWEQIARQDGKSISYYTQLRSRAYALARKNIDSLREEINNYYNGLPFNSYNIGRSKQKKLLGALVGRKVNHALSYAEWEEVFDNVPMNKIYRTIFYLANGVEGYGGGMDFVELAEFFIERAKEKKENVIKLGDRQIEFDVAAKTMQYLLHNCYMHLIKDESRHRINEILKSKEKQKSTLISSEYGLYKRNLQLTET